MGLLDHACRVLDGVAALHGHGVGRLRTMEHFGGDSLVGRGLGMVVDERAVDEGGKHCATTSITLDGRMLRQPSMVSRL